MPEPTGPRRSAFQVDTYARLHALKMDLAARFPLEVQHFSVGGDVCMLFRLVVDGRTCDAGVLRIGTDSADLWRCAVSWPTSWLPMPTSELWLRLGPATGRAQVAAAVGDLLQQRLDGFRRCKSCGRWTAPEHGGEHCHACLAADGAVF